MGLFEMLASTHPATADRIIATEAEISGMQPLPSHLTTDTPRFQEMKKRLPAKKK
jgi:predicted Zn-dependent protease